MDVPRVELCAPTLVLKSIYHIKDKCKTLYGPTGLSLVTTNPHTIRCDKWRYTIERDTPLHTVCLCVPERKVIKQTRHLVRITRKGLVLLHLGQSSMRCASLDLALVLCLNLNGLWQSIISRKHLLSYGVARYKKTCACGQVLAMSNTLPTSKLISLIFACPFS